MKELPGKVLKQAVVARHEVVTLVIPTNVPPAIGGKVDLRSGKLVDGTWEVIGLLEVEPGIWEFKLQRQIA